MIVFMCIYCRIYKQLITCVDDIFVRRCSSGAARLYDQLVTTFVPSQVMAECYKDGGAEPRVVTNDAGANGSIRVTRAHTTMVISTVFVLVWRFLRPVV